MSFSMTTHQIENRTKTVTRRLGWTFLKPGDLLCACKKVMGRRKGEGIERLAYLVVTDVTREPLSNISRDDVSREGFRGMTPHGFVHLFGMSMGCRPDTEVTRIEFRYMPGRRLWGC